MIPADDPAAETFDIDSAPNAEPEVDAGWLAEFEAELKPRRDGRGIRCCVLKTGVESK